jgi:hypothetical protein
MLEKMKEAPDLAGNATDEEYDQYFKYIYSLAAEDFPDPQELIKKWEYAISGTPEATDERFQFKDNYNIEIILDSSGSMNNMVNGKSQMDLAKETINKFLSSQFFATAFNCFCASPSTLNPMTLTTEALSKIEKDLENTGDKKLEEIEKEINEKYNSNVSQE